MKNRFALLLGRLGIGDRICLIPLLKKLKKEYLYIDVYFMYYKDEISTTLPFFDNDLYVDNYYYGFNNLTIPSNYDGINQLIYLNSDFFSKEIHTSEFACYLLGYDYSDALNSLKIDIPMNILNNYKLNNYYIIASGQKRPPYGRFFDISIYENLIKSFPQDNFMVMLTDPNARFNTDYHNVMYYYPKDLFELQCLIKKSKGMITIDTSYQHYAYALGVRSIVLWGFGNKRLTTNGYKNFHINLYRKNNSVIDDYCYFDDYYINENMLINNHINSYVLNNAFEQLKG